MTERKMTLADWHHFLEEKFQEVPRESIRFLSLEALPRLMYALDTQRHLCEDCALRYDKLLSMIIEAPGWLKNNTPEADLFRKELQDVTRELATRHGIYPKGLWLSRFTGFGILGGVALSFLLYAISNSTELPGILILGAGSGMMIGWIFGKIKEHHIRKDGKLF